MDPNVILQTKGLFSSTLVEIVSGQYLQLCIADSHVFHYLSVFQLFRDVHFIIKAKEEL